MESTEICKMGDEIHFANCVLLPNRLTAEENLRLDNQIIIKF